MSAATPQPGSPPPARTALVTGASRGIGRSIALGLADAGVDVALLARDAQALSEVAAQVRSAGVRAAIAVVDVTRLPDVRAAVAAVHEELGGIDLLINNAGRIDSAEVPAWEADPQEWWAVFETNVRGCFNMVHAVVPGMLARGGGRVVDLSSGAATRDNDVYSAYYPSKTALLRLGSGLADAGRPHGLRVFEIAPGVVRTDMTAGMAVHGDRTDWTEPAEVVALVTAVAAGRLDRWSGCFLRAGADTVEALESAGRDDLPDGARRLRIQPWGPDDPMA